MDGKNLINCSSLAITSLYNKLWSLIPDARRLNNPSNPSNKLETCYDPTLTFDNRFQYKLTTIDYANRTSPWHYIIWNTENGLEKSDHKNRKFETSKMYENNAIDRFDVTYANMTINLGICSNSLLASLEMQEVLLLNMRPGIFLETVEHPTLGKISVYIEEFDNQLNKLERNNGTLCFIFCQAKIYYPIIGGQTEAYYIEQIDYENKNYGGDTITTDIIS